MKATPEQIQAVCGLLHSRGREVTADQVQAFLDRMAKFYVNKGHEFCEQTLADLILNNAKGATMCLHLHFGDAL